LHIIFAFLFVWSSSLHAQGLVERTSQYFFAQQCSSKSSPDIPSHTEKELFNEIQNELKDYYQRTTANLNLLDQEPPASCTPPNGSLTQSITLSLFPKKSISRIQNQKNLRTYTEALEQLFPALCDVQHELKENQQEIIQNNCQISGAFSNNKIPTGAQCPQLLSQQQQLEALQQAYLFGFPMGEQPELKAYLDSLLKPYLNHCSQLTSLSTQNFFLQQMQSTSSQSLQQAFLQPLKKRLCADQQRLTTKATPRLLGIIAIAKIQTDLHYKRKYGHLLCSLQIKYGQYAQMTENLLLAGSLLGMLIQPELIATSAGLTSQMLKGAWALRFRQGARLMSSIAAFMIPQGMASYIYLSRVCEKSLSSESLTALQYSSELQSQLAEGHCRLGILLESLVVLPLIHEFPRLKKLVSSSSFQNIAELRGAFRQFHWVQGEDNKKFIQLAFQRNSLVPTHSVRYFDVENTVLKELNDKVLKDKTLVNSLTNLQKEIVRLHIQKYPQLERKLIAKYSDYKSIRLAFQNLSPNDEKAVEAFYQSLQIDYAQRVQNLISHDPNFLKARSAIQNPLNWFRGGLGTSADEASMAARLARRQDGAGLQLLNFSKIERDIQKYLAEFHSLNSNLSKEKLLSTKAWIFDSEAGPIPSEEWLGVLRKLPQQGTSQNQIHFLQNEAQKRFALHLTSSEAQEQKRLFELCDLFSPAIYSEVRTLLPNSLQQRGHLYLDLEGMGNHNLHLLYRALLQTREPKEALVLARNSELLATKGMQKKVSFIQNFQKQKMATYEQVFVSGDDVTMSTRPHLFGITERQVQEFLLSSPEGIRITGVYRSPTTLIWNTYGIATQGEAFQKAFLERLIELQKSPAIPRIALHIMVPPAQQKASLWGAQLTLFVKGKSISPENIHSLFQELIQQYHAAPSSKIIMLQ